MSQRQWLRPEDAEHKLLLEANSTTLALGHRMTDWVKKAGRCYSRCVQCYEAAVVAARVMGEPTMRGAALSLRCGGRRG